MPVAIIVCIVVYAAFVLSIGCETSGDNPRDAYYNRLADGFLSGHTYLEKTVPAPLLAARDPYAPAVIEKSLGLPFTSSSAHDLSYRRGHLYLYFSAAPAVLLFVPFRFATGYYFQQPLACFVFVAGALFIAAYLIVDVWRRNFAKVGSAAVGGGVLAIGLVPLTPLLLQRPDVYEVPVSGAYFFTMAALACVWRAAASGGWTVARVAALSVSAGLAFACRPSEFAGLGLLLLPLVDQLNPATAHDGLDRPRGFMRVFGAATLPVVGIGGALLAYNYARFGDVWEFGVKYQLNIDPAHAAHFSSENVAFNAWHYLLHFPGWSWHFPFAGPWSSGWIPPQTIVGVEHPVGCLAAAPFLVLGFAAVGWFRTWPPALRRFVVVAIGIAAANFLVLCSFFGTCSRYELAFAPEFTLVAVFALLTLESRIAEKHRSLRFAVRGCWVAALCFSVAYGVLFATRARGDSYVKRGLGSAMSHDLNAALADFTHALRRDPDNLAALKLKAECEYLLERAEDARRDLESIVAQDPVDEEAWNHLGVLLSREPGREKEALASFGRCTQLKPRDAEAHFNVGVALLRSGGDRNLAIRELHYALRLNPALDAARHALNVAGENSPPGN